MCLETEGIHIEAQKVQEGEGAFSTRGREEQACGRYYVKTCRYEGKTRISVRRFLTDKLGGLVEDKDGQEVGNVRNEDACCCGSGDASISGEKHYIFHIRIYKSKNFPYWCYLLLPRIPTSLA